MTEHANLYELLATRFFICVRLNVCYPSSWWWCPLFYNREFQGPPISQGFISLVFFPAYVLYLLCQYREFGHQEAERRGSVLTLKLDGIGVRLVQGATAAQQSPTGSCARWNFPIGLLFLLLWSLDSLFHQMNVTHAHQSLCLLVG